MLSRRLVRRFALALAVAALAVGGCGELAQKERELTFRVVPGDASWYSGLPDGVRETASQGQRPEVPIPVEIYRADGEVAAALTVVWTLRLAP